MTKQLLKMLLMGLAGLTVSNSVQAMQIEICHKDGNTLTIDASAWQAHKAHGDLWGSCDRHPTYAVVVIFRCGLSAGGGLVVTTVSSSADIPLAVPQVVPADNCADANAMLNDFKFELLSVTSGSVDANFETEYAYSRRFFMNQKPH